ncbi:amino acid adenylation domain-containing protein [Streptomyces sp. NBC_00582]|uniref:amino acid adenylation domain-containing protein n=1 Tax=Streptomyces sp. NBC_00582 TaxID=2975783 RepID=UPI002E80EB2C|nr:amino acid adenylation domain-containing protein [Streptomyces sp. NBC_00582]WUB63931.1 amino acid adenylation domain-containing protein [Streptomyces sp. NBC_00582]
MTEPIVSPVLTRFSAYRREHPDAPAVTADGVTHSYAELDVLARRHAGRLRAAGAGPESVVALVADRGPGYVALVLGVLLAGAAFVPVEPGVPVRRARRMCADAGVRVLLVEPAHEEFATRVVAGLDPVPGVLVADAEPARRPTPDPAPDADAVPDRLRDGLAYVIFTSGSTGTPKGAMVADGGMDNHMAAKIADLGLGPADVIGLTAPLSFDISVWQTLTALAVGARTAVASPHNISEPAELVAWVRRHGVTVLEIVPSFLAVLTAQLDDDLRAGLSSLRYLVATGEALPGAVARRWYEHLPDVPIVNAYGPTECSDDVTHHVVTAAESAARPWPSIGREILHTRLYVVDAEGREVPAGTEGELLVGGAGVGRGYIGDPVRTALTFVPDGLSGTPGARLYRTADRVSRAADGTVDFHGRRDRQVKIRGHRVELGDVEAELLRVPGVRAAACVFTGGRLRAFVTLDAPTDVTTAVRATAPRYLVPHEITVLDRLPTNTSGKTDHRALSTMSTEATPPPLTPGAGSAPASTPAADRAPDAGSASSSTPAADRSPDAGPALAPDRAATTAPDPARATVPDSASAAAAGRAPVTALDPVSVAAPGWAPAASADPASVAALGWAPAASANSASVAAPGWAPATSASPASVAALDRAPATVPDPASAASADPASAAAPGRAPGTSADPGPGAAPGLDRTPVTASVPSPSGRSAPVPVQPLGIGAVCELVGEVLGVGGVGADDDFFGAGGDSLLAMTLVAGARVRFGAPGTSLRAFLGRPTPRGLLAAIEEAEPVAAAGEPRAAGALSSGQERLWFFEQLHRRKAPNLLILALDLYGPLDEDALRHALAAVVARHEPLRTVFTQERGVPKAVVRPTAELALDQGASREVEISARTPEPPLAKVRWERVADDHHVLTVALHHLVADGWSLEVLKRDIAEHYERARAGDTTVTAPRSSYSHYVAAEQEWLAGPDAEECTRYWTGQLAGTPGAIDLPLDRPRPARPAFVTDHVVTHLTAEETKALAETARAAGATPFMAVLAASYVVLREVTATDDLVLGIDSVNRSWPGSEELIGTFVNQLPVRLAPGSAPSFGDLLDLARRQVLGAQEHDRLPFHKLVAAVNPPRVAGRFPLFQVKVTHQGAWRTATRLGDLRVEPRELADPVMDLDLTIDVSGETDRLRLEVLFWPETLDRATVATWTRALADVLRAGAADPDALPTFGER